MRCGVLMLTVLSVLGCGESPPTPITQAEQDHARAAAKEMMTRLLGALSEVVGEKGHAAAIDVCREAAPRIAKEVGVEFGVRIGRTSHRLRNPGNRAPDWAKAFVKQAGGSESKVSAQRGPGSKTCMTIPIFLKPMCVTCHGAEDEIPADVRAALVKAYPEDRATGFKPGELRGFVWVEWATPE